jgi:alkanesulfonate monooxygenase SsuD/methylene tetrahydromethanopterin reductase-like flavin-dependent oxidoreductase (luciferase family)
LTEQVLDLALKAWAHEYGDPPLEFDTPLFKGRLDGRIIPTSVRKPHPLIARACVSDESVVRSAERGWPIFTGRFGPERSGRQWALYRETLARAAHPPSVEQECRDWSAMLKIVYVAESDAQAEADIAEPLANYLRAAYVANSADRIESLVVQDGVRDGPLLVTPNQPPQDPAAFKQRAMIYGAPDSVIRQIEEYAAAGVTGMMLWLTWGYNDPGRVQRSLRLFVDQVMPHFATAETGCTGSSSPSTSC